MTKKEQVKEAVEKCRDELKETKQDIKDDKLIINELTELVQRVQADFDNYRRHVEKSKKDAEFFFKKEIISALLPVLDMFELALKYTSNNEEFVKGVKMIYAQFLATLENEGLAPVKDLKTFNPGIHEAVISEESPEPDGAILEELQKGYMLNNKVLRFSRVKISKKHEKVQ
jgi:molecular chaperone GrpE